MRKRIFNTDNNISKVSFFKYIFHKKMNLSAGFHLLKKKISKNFCPIAETDKYYILEDIKIYPEINILLHFKFIKPNLQKVFKTRILENQDWNDSSEYKSYLQKFKK